MFLSTKVMLMSTLYMIDVTSPFYTLTVVFSLSDHFRFPYPLLTKLCFLLLSQRNPKLDSSGKTMCLRTSHMIYCKQQQRKVTHQ